jgi:hypothetical protein
MVHKFFKVAIGSIKLGEILLGFLKAFADTVQADVISFAAVSRVRARRWSVPIRASLAHGQYPLMAYAHQSGLETD